MRAALLAAAMSGLLAAPAVGQGSPDAGGGFVGGALSACKTDLRLLNQVAGWPVRWPGELEEIRVETADQQDAALTNWRRAPAALAGARRRLEEGLAAGNGAPRAVVRRVLDQVDRLLIEPRASSALWSPARRSEERAFVRAWEDLVGNGLLPAIAAYRDFLRDDYLPATRTSPGLESTPGGAGCYEAVVTGWTSLDITPAAVEAKGRAVIADLEAELERLAPAELGSSAAEILANLRAASDEATGEELLRVSRAAQERARRSIGEWIGTPGRDTILVEEMSAHLQPSFPAGYYAPPVAAGEPGRYIVNTSRPGTRRLMAEVISFHEGVPGHHTSFVARQALGGGSGPFNAGLIEGWALYAERLAQEMGIYSARRDELGLVTKHLWAASRLVVEPGIHVDGWTRRQAIDFMFAHTALPVAEIELEVDRYIGLPGQSLAYMLGYLFLRDLRGAAETRLDEAFDVREFHDVVLRGGSRPLATVETDVEAWIASR